VQNVPSDLALGRLAARQYGHVTYAQLVALGFTRRAIEVRIRHGRLIRVFRGVYAVGHVRSEATARGAAAVLAGGDAAALSYFSAAALWEMGPKWPGVPEITVPAKRQPAGIRVHVHPSLESRDIRRHRGIRTTGPSRTLLDIAPGLTDAGLARAINQGRLQRHLRIADLEDVIGRYPHHRGAHLLRPFVVTPTGPTRSEFEDRFLAFAREHGLPTPNVNARVAGYEVDALFAAHKVIVELDGYEYHRGRRSFERDRERDAALLAAGYVTIRITWERLTTQPEREAARLRQILTSRTLTP
jgi:very-short-patch-repair endonuclease